MTYFNYNGKIFTEGTAVTGADSRALRYGDGLFETLKWKNDAVILPDEHFARLWKGMQYLKFSIPKLFTPEKLLEEIKILTKKNALKDARIRLSILRGNGGLYDVQNLQPNYIIQAWPLPAANAQLNLNGLELCVYKDMKKPCDAFSNLKHNNFLVYIMAALYAKELKCNDALIMNDQGRIADSSMANIFIIKDGNIITPALSEACVAGTLRQYLLKQLPANGYTVNEQPIDEGTLADADEVFLTNAIYNIRWVKSIGQKTYGSSVIRRIDQVMRQTNPAVFC